MLSYTSIWYSKCYYFVFNQSGWQDKELITKYEFFYSMDGGNIYIPLESTNFS